MKHINNGSIDMLRNFINFVLGAVLPMHFMGGGGGDGGAGDAKKSEAERQARIKAAVDTINGIFDSKPVTIANPAAPGVQATSFDPGTTYYRPDGSVWTPPTTKVAQTGDAYSSPFINMVDGLDESGAREAIAAGGLYTAGNTPQTTTFTPTSRDTLYNQQKDAVFRINKQAVDKQQQEAERQNRFGLARSGLMGGSVDVDSNADITERANKGLMQAVGLGDQAAADLKTADERSRQSLISMAQSGIDTGTAQTMAMRQLDAAAQQAAGDRQGATIGNLFGDMSQAYLANQARAGQLAGRNPNQQWYGVSNPRTGDAGSVAR
jgi:hypothetical protein